MSDNTSTAPASNSNVVGRVTQIRGPVIDVQFEGPLPSILNALHIDLEGHRLVLEVAQEIGERVKCVALRWIRRMGLCAARKSKTLVSRSSPGRPGNARAHHECRR